MMMTSERRVSVHDVTSCECASVIGVVYADRRSRSVDSGLVTDVDVPQRPLTTVTVPDTAVKLSSVPFTSRVVGSCDSGLVEQDTDACSRQDSVKELTDRLNVCDCSTVLSSSVSGRTQHRDRPYDCHSSPSSVTVTNSRQSWLLRLFESKLFDMSIAIQYLFNSKESGVQTYIGEFWLHTVHQKVYVFVVCFVGMFCYRLPNQ